MQDNSFANRKNLENNFDYVAVIDKDKLLEAISEAEKENITAYLACVLIDGKTYQVGFAKLEDNIIKYGIDSSLDSSNMSLGASFGFSTLAVIEKKEEFVEKLNVLCSNKIVVLYDIVETEEGNDYYAITSNYILEKYKTLRSSNDYKEVVKGRNLTITPKENLAIFLISMLVLIIFILVILIIVFITQPTNTEALKGIIVLLVIGIVQYVLGKEYKKVHLIINDDQIKIRKTFSKEIEIPLNQFNYIKDHLITKTGGRVVESHKYTLKANNGYKISTQLLAFGSLEYEYLQYVIACLKENNIEPIKEQESGNHQLLRVLLYIFGVAILFWIIGLLLEILAD